MAVKALWQPEAQKAVDFLVDLYKLSCWEMPKVKKIGRASCRERVYVMV